MKVVGIGMIKCPMNNWPIIGYKKNMKKFTPERMLQSKLKHHLESDHYYMVRKHRDFFVRKLIELKQQINTFFKTVSIPYNA